MLTALINSLMQFEQDIVLVLDDYHSITSQSIHSSLTFFLEHLPPCLHVIIATRVDPLLPLARWRARGRLTEIRSADLRFTTEETAAFFQQAVGLPLSIEEIDALDKRAEGWIAGLQLAALSMHGRKDISDFIKVFTGSHRYIVDYLIQEVFDRQPANIQTFLLRTSILERMCGSLCEAISGQPGGQAMLEHLEQVNLFLQPLDDERRWYRYHHLFAELLRHRLQREQPELAPTLHRQASAWFEQHDLLPEAIRHSLAAADFQSAARLIEQVGITLTKRGELITLSSWLDKLPAEEMQARPGLTVLRAWLLFLTGQYAAAEQQLQEIEQRYSIHAAMQTFEGLASPPQGMQHVYHLIGEIAAIRASIVIMQGDGERTIELAQQALRYLAEDDISRGLVMWYLGLAYWIAGNLEAAVQAMVDACAYSMAHGNLYMAFMTTHELASFQAAQGYLHQAEHTYRQALQLVNEQDSSTVVLGPIHVGIGSLQYEWNNLEAAERFLQTGIQQCLYMENSRTALDGYIVLTRIRHARGDQEGVQMLCEKMSSLASHPNVPPTQARFQTAFLARIALEQGNAAEASRWAQQCGLRASDEIHPLRFNEYLILARILIAQGNFDDASTCLRQLFHLAQARKRIKNSIEVLILQALAHQAQGDIETATGTLEHALLLAETEGYIRLFVDEGPVLANLLIIISTKLQKQADTSSAVPELLTYIEKLLVAFGDQNFPLTAASPRPSPAIPTGTRPSLAEPLSERELEVLRLISEGCSNREIADRLVLAVSTVKWYVNIIYGKLQVESRTKAVARARELKLI